jgi:protein SCO1/2
MKAIKVKYMFRVFFTTCPSICKMNQSMLLIEKKFFGNPNFGIVSITIDPRHDTPSFERTCCAFSQVLKWNLTGRDKIYDLANKGFNLEKIVRSTEALSILGCLP